MDKNNIIIITGLSGSGKSTALAACEDWGFYCVDNMPVELLPKFLELPTANDANIAGCAFVMDLREKGFLQRYHDIFEQLESKGYNFIIIFLESSEDILVQRYSQTRRHHPFDTKGNLMEAIKSEKEQLGKIKDIATTVIDTSHYNIHKLKALILSFVQKNLETHTAMSISIVSFGFKYGLPKELNLVIDVRFLPNPYFDPDMKNLTGESYKVREYVINNHEGKMFIAKYLSLLEFLIPLYQQEGRSYLAIGVGCTGGRHRSVAIANYISEHINNPDLNIKVIHRDIDQ